MKKELTDEEKELKRLKIKEQRKNAYLRRKEKNLLYQKEYNKINKDKIKEYSNNNNNIKEYQKQYQKKYRESKKDLSKPQSVKRNYDMNTYQKEYQKEYRQTNKGKYKEYHKEYQRKVRKSITPEQKEQLKIKNNLRQKERLKKDPLFKLKCYTRSSIYISLKEANYTKKSKSFEILGCSYEDFKLHLESQFESWMTWGNYGNPKDGIFEPNKTWDIDHIIPLSSYTNEKELLELNHYTNLRPLCSYQNRFIKRNNL